MLVGKEKWNERQHLEYFKVHKLTYNKILIENSCVYKSAEFFK